MRARGRSGAAIERTRSQTEETLGEMGVGLGLRRGGRVIRGNGDVFCADGVTAEESDGSYQSRRGRAEGTVEEREELGGHELGGSASGGGHEMRIELSNGGIIVNVGDLVLVVILARRRSVLPDSGVGKQARQGKARRGRAGQAMRVRAEC